ncbi:CinA family protein [Roseovarius sp. PS-C2]|uniref:CinA family protein n=1 Tax=Roseovarius sp. PS-C2 TaxID=2820814 RepID=UPI001C0BB279|nr:CinA family protein [Roseovarius sp. PS-C2]MBU3259730.1 CinA family protein [Roseovarius sp. PS-C2]
MITNDILDLARSLNLRIATAESCTGGMVAVALTDIPGSSDVMDRGFVTYSNAAKVEMLGVSTDTLIAHGAVSEQVAREMAEGALSRSGADLSVAITGIAGPGGSEHKPEGRVCFGLARKGLKTFTETKEFGAPGRSEVRQMSRDHALELLHRSLS